MELWFFSVWSTRVCVCVCETILLPDVEDCPFRTLGTPNNDVWPDVESLPDYKNTFPKWKSGNLSVKNLDKNGLDLLAVRTRGGGFHELLILALHRARQLFSCWWECARDQSSGFWMWL